MAQVSVTIGGRTYRMACDDGQEDHLIKLARELDEKIARLREAFGEVGDTRLTVMAAITISDDLSECRRRIRGLEHDIEGLK
jgi:cell division protein ZapA